MIRAVLGAFGAVLGCFRPVQGVGLDALSAGLPSAKWVTRGGVSVYPAFWGNQSCAETAVGVAARLVGESAEGVAVMLCM